MLSIQHILCATLHNKNAKDTNYMAAVVFPDAIRAYSGPRQYSHFEKGSKGSTDVSWWSLPTYMKGVNKDQITAHLLVAAHLSNSILPAAIGEDTDITAFYEHNQHLPESMYHGVEDHLKQDIEFDKFIRQEIDCSDKYNDKFLFQGKEYNGKDIRGIIGKIEQQGIYILAHKLYEQQGITVNQQWLQDKIKPILDKEYPQDLADKTFSFMKIDEKINEKITNHDWSDLDNSLISLDHFNQLYNAVLNYMDDQSKTTNSIHEEAEEDMQLE